MSGNYTYQTSKGGKLVISSGYISWKSEDPTEKNKNITIEAVIDTHVLGSALVCIISKNDDAIRFVAKNSSDAYHICKLIDERKKQSEKAKVEFKNSSEGIKQSIQDLESKIKVIYILLIGVAISFILSMIGLTFADESFTLCGIGIVLYIVFNLIIGSYAGKLGTILDGLNRSTDNWTSNDKGIIENGVSGCMGTGCIGASGYFVGIFYGLIGWIFAIVKIYQYKSEKESLLKTLNSKKAEENTEEQ